MIGLKSIIDIHSHILPGVDDGASVLSEYLDMIDIYKAQNVEAVICTPHFGPCGYPEADIPGVFTQCSSQTDSFGLFLGNEVLYTDSTLTDLRNKSAKTLNGTDYILVEFDEWKTYHVEKTFLVESLLKLAQSEYKPVLAHAERYEAVQYDLDICQFLSEHGVLLQVNAYDLFEQKKESCRNAAQWLAKNRLITFIGSDCHGYHRPPNLLSGVNWLYNNVPEEYADAVVHGNAKKLLGI